MRLSSSWLLLAVLPLLALRCDTKKNDPLPATLPPETQEGKNTFGCYLDSKLWLREYASGMGRGVSLDVGGGRLFLVCRSNGSLGYESVIGFDFCQGFSGERTYSLFFPQANNCNEAYVRMESVRYYADSLGDNHLIITRFDSVSRILSGRFQFTAVTRPRFRGDPLPPDTVRLTDGRFCRSGCAGG